MPPKWKRILFRPFCLCWYCSERVLFKRCICSIFWGKCLKPQSINRCLLGFLLVHWNVTSGTFLNKATLTAILRKFHFYSFRSKIHIVSIQIKIKVKSQIIRLHMSAKNTWKYTLTVLMPCCLRHFVFVYIVIEKVGSAGLLFNFCIQIKIYGIRHVTFTKFPIALLLISQKKHFNRLS